MIDAGRLDRVVDLSRGDIRGLLPRGAEVGQIAGERDRIPDHQVELCLATASASVVIVVVATGGDAEDEHKSGGCGEEPLGVETSHYVYLLSFTSVGGP